MAVANRLRTDKSVLTRQDIVSRKRALTDQKLETSSVGRRAIASVLAFAVALLALIAVATYDPRDGRGGTVHNAIGPVGHHTAEWLRTLWGVCAYVLPVAGLYAAGSLAVG